MIGCWCVCVFVGLRACMLVGVVVVVVGGVGVVVGVVVVVVCSR